jgi:hypothetical protein
MIYVLQLKYNCDVYIAQRYCVWIVMVYAWITPVGVRMWVIMWIGGDLWSGLCLDCVIPVHTIHARTACQIERGVAFKPVQPKLAMTYKDIADTQYAGQCSFASQDKQYDHHQASVECMATSMRTCFSFVGHVHGYSPKPTET